MSRSNWKSDVTNLKGKTNEEILASFSGMKRYKDSDIIWMNDEGKVLYATSAGSPEGKTDLTVTDAFNMIKHDNKNDFLLQVYLKGKEESGYAILETPRSLIGTKWAFLREKYTHLWFAIVIGVFLLFVFNSWRFFSKLQKRLVNLEKHMKTKGDDGITQPLGIKRNDELGQVECSFNHMVEELRTSRRKEREEAEIRKKLIADLSHDLRTPLTVIRGHTFSLKDEDISEKGSHSL
ncbi:HAMP domain-containing protein [Bacillus swezeyi]|uniref:HAMP domain-containing protein n=1 Tax=Bacillus swezeyi TaxID=1925020 RepID=UPI001CC26D11|nr:histidine kinase dimerization/phospho-acceptor domain-containing protein [Bacillus swezeyi]